MSNFPCLWSSIPEMSHKPSASQDSLFKNAGTSSSLLGMALPLEQLKQAHQPWTVSAGAPCAGVSSFRTSMAERARQRAFPPPRLLATRTITRVINNLNPTCIMQRYNFRNHSEPRPNRLPRHVLLLLEGKGKYCFGSKKGEGSGGGKGEEEADPVFDKSVPTEKIISHPQSEAGEPQKRGACCSWPLAETARRLGHSSGETAPCTVISSFDFFWLKETFQIIVEPTLLH